MQPFLALITPVGGGGGGERPPLGIWGPTDPRPTPPIVLPIPPDAIAPGVPTHPIYIPIFPAHPIVIPPDAIAPGVPTHPIVLPPIIWGPDDPRPTPPIVIPPDAISPGVPTHPIVLPPEIWGPTDPRPGQPIYLPPAAGSLAWYGVAASGQVWGPFYSGGGSGPAPGPPGNFPPSVQPVRK